MTTRQLPRSWPRCSNRQTTRSESHGAAPKPSRSFERAPTTRSFQTFACHRPIGVALTEIVQSEWPDVAVVLVTAFATVPLAVEAMKKGAADFIMKPFDREQLLTSLRNALAARASLRKCPPENPERNLGIIGDCEAMRVIVRDVEKAAQLDVPVLIQGESGTGKGLIAQAIHAASRRSGRSFVRVQVSSLPDTLIDSELFGYDRQGGQAA